MTSDTIDIVIPTWNQQHMTCACLDALKSHTFMPFRVIWVDSGSDMAAILDVRRSIDRLGLDVFEVLLPENLGPTHAINEGLKVSASKFVVVLNNDVMVTDRWLRGLLGHMIEEPRVGVIAPVTDHTSCIASVARIARKLHIDEVPDDLAAYFGNHEPKRVDVASNISFFCVAIRREAMLLIGFLDAVAYPVLGCDDDYNQRMRDEDYLTSVAVNSFVHHVHQSTRKIIGDKAAIRAFEAEVREKLLCEYS